MDPRSHHQEILEQNNGDAQSKPLIEHEMVAVAAPHLTPARQAASIFRRVNTHFLLPVKDITFTMAIGYGLFDSFAIMVAGKNRAFFNIAYIVPALVPAYIHYLSSNPVFKQANLKKLHVFQHIMGNSAFINAAAQSTLLLVGRKLSRMELILGIIGIKAYTIGFGSAYSYYDLNMRADRNYHPAAENFIKFFLRPLQMGANTMIITGIFSEHLKIAPNWMPLAAGAVFALPALGYEIFLNHHDYPDNRLTRIIRDFVVDGLLTGLSINAFIYAAIESWYAADHENTIPLSFLYGMLVIPILLLSVWMSEKIITHNDNENLLLEATVARLKESDDEESFASDDLFYDTNPPLLDAATTDSGNIGADIHEIVVYDETRKVLQQHGLFSKPLSLPVIHQVYMDVSFEETHIEPAIAATSAASHSQLLNIRK